MSPISRIPRNSSPLRAECKCRLRLARLVDHSCLTRCPAQAARSKSRASKLLAVRRLQIRPAADRPMRQGIGDPSQFEWRHRGNFLRAHYRHQQRRVNRHWIRQCHADEPTSVPDSLRGRDERLGARIYYGLQTPGALRRYRRQAIPSYLLKVSAPSALPEHARDNPCAGCDNILSQTLAWDHVWETGFSLTVTRRIGFRFQPTFDSRCNNSKP